MNTPTIKNKRPVLYFIASFLYALGQIMLGLLVHPYQTMQLLVQEKVFVSLSLLPTILLGIVTVIWRYVVVPSVQLVFSCGSTRFWACQYIDFVSNWLTFFMIFWQILLLYLFFRFWWVYRS